MKIRTKKGKGSIPYFISNRIMLLILFSCLLFPFKFHSQIFIKDNTSITIIGHTTLHVNDSTEIKSPFGDTLVIYDIEQSISKEKIFNEILIEERDITNPEKQYDAEEYEKHKKELELNNELPYFEAGETAETFITALHNHTIYCGGSKNLYNLEIVIFNSETVTFLFDQKKKISSYKHFAIAPQNKINSLRGPPCLKA
ncbi:hypothetical protein [Chryseobacterium sp. CT-SW4]|uniref:hypothetical protein n=1 Tax=Chryseobacterium sp. SW-1 TaxID=3157343 RepID=UPI003B01D160